MESLLTSFLAVRSRYREERERERRRTRAGAGGTEGPPGTGAARTEGPPGMGGARTDGTSEAQLGRLAEGIVGPRTDPELAAATDWTVIGTVAAARIVDEEVPGSGTVALMGCAAEECGRKLGFTWTFVPIFPGTKLGLIKTCIGLEATFSMLEV